MTVPVPYTFPIEVIALPPNGRHYDLVADEAARAAVARALGLESLDELKARLSVTPAAGGTVDVTGSFSARVVQACVITLVPVPAAVTDQIKRRFVAAPATPAAPAKAKKKTKKFEEPEEEETEGWVDPNAEIIDPMIDSKIDLGEVLTEQLSLSLNPYPRAPGASFAAINPGEQGEEAPATSPFAALAGLKVGKAAPRRADGKGGGKPRPGKGKSGR